MCKEEGIRCICNKCGVSVPNKIDEHFTAEDGRILCKNCSIGVKPCSPRIKKLLIK